MKNRYIAHTVKGLEFTTKAELLNKVADIDILEVDQKKIIFESGAIFDDSSMFRTFDDLSLYITSFHYENEDDLYEKLIKIDLKPAVEIIKSIRPIDKVFSMTFSKYKPEDIDSETLIEKLANHFEKQLQYIYTHHQHDNLDIKLQIEKDFAYVMIKVFTSSLYNRSYRLESQFGAIRPSIAGAMLYHLTNGASGLNVVDNFCGSGTFLCEALLNGNRVYGGDISPESVSSTIKNLHSIQSKLTQEVQVLDGMKTNWPSNFFDLAISNLPWDKQISVKSFSELYSKAILEYGRILKPSGSLAIIGSKPELMVKYVKQIFPERRDSIKVIKIGYLGQSPSVLFSQP